MKKSFFSLLFVLPLLVSAQKQLPFLAEMDGLMARNQDQILSLAEAFPENKYDWAPAQGVRSAGKVMLHVASANYFLGMSLGLPLPNGVDPMSMESLTGKEKIKETVKGSFEFAKKAIAMLNKKNKGDMVELPFGKFSKSQLALIIFEHTGEHKGQLIAYARANGIAPPWSN